MAIQPSPFLLMATTNVNGAAQCLLGKTLIDGWNIVDRWPESEGATGGRFSVGYIAERDGLGAEGFARLEAEIAGDAAYPPIRSTTVRAAETRAAFGDGQGSLFGERDE